jgi:hypothetical protein
MQVSTELFAQYVKKALEVLKSRRGVELELASNRIYHFHPGPYES